MDKNRLDEIVREVEKNRPRWVVLRGKEASGRTTLARRLCAAAVREFHDTRSERSPGVAGQVLWYSRDDQFGNNSKNAHHQLELLVKEVVTADIPEAPITYVPKRFEGAVSQRDVIGINVVAVVFDDIFPGRVLCDAVHRRVRE